MIGYSVIMEDNISVRLYADMHITDGIFHLFYTFKNGLVFSCPISASVTEIEI